MPSRGANDFDQRDIGKFQIWLILICGVLMIAHRVHMQIIDFASLEPAWQCLQNVSACKVNQICPASNDVRCRIPRSTWEFTGSKTYSIVTQYDLICDRKWYVEVVSSAFFIGWAPGSLFFGPINHKYGRRNVLFAVSALFFLTSLSCVFSTNVWVVVSLRFISGFLLGGKKSNLVLITSEFVGFRHRPLALGTINVMNGLSIAVLTVNAYFVRPWKYLYALCTVPYLFILPAWFFIPESPAWLRNEEKVDELVDTLSYIDAANGHIALAPEIKPKSESDGDEHQIIEIELYGHDITFWKPLLWAILSFTTAMSYMALTFTSPFILPGHLYLNYLLSGIMEIPGCMLGVYSCRRLGRRKTMMWSTVSGGLLCIAIGLIPLTGKLAYWRLICSTLAKVGLAATLEARCTWFTEMHSNWERARAYGVVHLNLRSRGESRVRGQLSTPKFGTLSHFTKVSSNDFKVSK